MNSTKMFLICLSMLMQISTCMSECCTNKTVGSVDYTLTGVEDTSSYGCLDTCVYTSVQIGGKFCFSSGPDVTTCTASYVAESETQTEITLFTNFCGSSTSRPICTCLDSSTFLHPYYFVRCSDGSEPVSCVCPSGGFFPANQEQMAALGLISKK